MSDNKELAGVESHCFYATLTVDIEINNSDFNVILMSCKKHYDHTVRASIEVGGFLYGAKNRRDFFDGKDILVRLSNRELQLVIKSLEYKDKDSQQANKIYDRLWSILREMSSVQNELNSKL
jgi:hypothetical protein